VVVERQAQETIPVPQAAILFSAPLPQLAVD
jgi:hypothetical protein